MSTADVQDQISRQRGAMDQTARSMQEARARLEELVAYQRVHNEAKWYQQDSLGQSRSLVMESGIDPASVKVWAGMSGLMTELLDKGDVHMAVMDDQSYVIAAAINQAEEELADLARLQVIQSDALQDLNTQLTTAEQKERENAW